MGTYKTGLVCMHISMGGCGVEKVDTKADVRSKRERYKNSWSLCTYIHIPTQ